VLDDSVNQLAFATDGAADVGGGGSHEGHLAVHDGDEDDLSAEVILERFDAELGNGAVERGPGDAPRVPPASGVPSW